MVVIDTSTDDGSSTQVGSQTRLRKYWQQTLRAPKAKPHTWSSLISRNGSVLFLALTASGMIAWTSYFAFSHTNHPRELPMDTDGGGKSIFVLQASTLVTALLLSELASACYERVRWQQASSSSGVLGGSLMGLSRGTSLAGVILLLVHPATHISSRLWCLNRIITYVMVFLIPLVLLLGLSFPTVQFVQVDFDPSMIVTTGWGDFNYSAVQEDVLGFDGFLESPQETFPLPSSPSRCNDIGTADTSLDLCESHLLFTGLSNIQTFDGHDFQPLVQSSSYQALATNAAGFMPWVESPWAVSFYQYDYNHTFNDNECGIFYSPSLATSMNNDQDTGNDDWSAPPPQFGAQVGMQMCVAALDSDDFMSPGTVGTNGTTVVMQVSVCGANCMGDVDAWFWKRGPPPRKAMFVAETSVSLSMTITKWFATPLYSTQNETVLSADLPLYSFKGMDQSSVLQTLGVSTDHTPARNYELPIPISIDGSHFRQFVLRPYQDVENYGNISDRFTLPNVLLNQIVDTVLVDNRDEAYALLKDLLAYSLREGSIPMSPDPFSLTPTLWTLQRARMQISLPAFYLFVAFTAAVALNCFVIFFWTSITDRASSTTLYPEVDFGAGFMSGHGRENELNRVYNSSSGIASTSSQGYDDLPGYDPDPPTVHPIDRRRNMSQEDFMTQTQEQIDLVSKLRRVHSGRVVHRMAQATFKVADYS